MMLRGGVGNGESCGPRQPASRSGPFRSGGFGVDSSAFHFCPRMHTPVHICPPSAHALHISLRLADYCGTYTTLGCTYCAAASSVLGCAWCASSSMCVTAATATCSGGTTTVCTAVGMSLHVCVSCTLCLRHLLLVSFDCFLLSWFFHSHFQNIGCDAFVWPRYMSAFSPGSVVFLLFQWCLLNVFFCTDYCPQYNTSCSDCIWETYYDCGWCASTNRCMKGGTDGTLPGSSGCAASDWKSYYGTDCPAVGAPSFFPLPLYLFLHSFPLFRFLCLFFFQLVAVGRGAHICIRASQTGFGAGLVLFSAQKSWPFCWKKTWVLSGMEFIRKRLALATLCTPPAVFFFLLGNLYERLFPSP